MKTELSVEEICILKKIASRFRKTKGYLTCLNGLARASGYKDWNALICANNNMLAT